MKKAAKSLSFVLALMFALMLSGCAQAVYALDASATARRYLNVMSFSREGLIHQLEYEGFTESAAAQAVDSLGINWNEQALKKAKSYLSTQAFSYKGLIHQLEYEKFTTEQATYGADSCGANWYEQASKKAGEYLRVMSMSRSRLKSQLIYEKFTAEQAEYGVSVYFG